jgi:hypothetical protein
MLTGSPFEGIVVGVGVVLLFPKRPPLNILRKAPPVSGVGDGVTEIAGVGCTTATCWLDVFLAVTFQATNAATVKTAKTTNNAIFLIELLFWQVFLILVYSKAPIFN